MKDFDCPWSYVRTALIVYYCTHILHSSESLVHNKFYLVYDYNHYNMVYNQCSICSGNRLSISNFECPPFNFLPLQGHLIIIHTCMPSTRLYVIHVDLYDYKLKISVPHVQLLIVIRVAKMGLL